MVAIYRIENIANSSHTQPSTIRFAKDENSESGVKKAGEQR